MGVDQARERFRAIRREIPPDDDDRPITDNEACTRVHLIDPILVDVLDWPRELMVVEPPGGESAQTSGASTREGRVDYVLRDRDETCWFVVEAKKRTHRLVEAIGAPRGLEELKLTGPVLEGECWPIISRQMAPYLGRYMPCFGAVTNGEQWIGFLAKLRPGNVLLERSTAAVFRSLDDIDRDFELFYELFGREGAQRRSLQSRLQPNAARGLRRAPHARRVVPPGGERPVDYQNRQFYDDLRQAMDAAFRPIRADRDALAACFVETRESQAAGSRLERIANELGEVLRGAVEHYPPAVEGEVDSVSAKTAEIEGILPGEGYIARLLGEKSAGKTVFLERLFNLQLGERRERIALLWFEAERAAPFDATQASRSILNQLVGALFGEDGPSWEQLREVYRREWNHELRLVGIGEGDAAVSLRQAFVRRCEEAETRDPQDALRRYADFATRNRRRLVCLVVDNLDHLDHPEPVVAWAVAIHRSVFAMTTIAMEDSTLWRLRRAGSDQLADHQPEQFWLHRPMVREVVQNRCDYLRKVLEASASDSGKTTTTVGRRGQWRWSVGAEVLARTVSAVLLEDEDVAQWIGQLCNHDLREVLEVCQQIVLSPHIKAEQLLTMQATQRAPQPYRLLRTLIAPKSEQFQALPTDRATNIFGHWLGQDFAPLLPARVLAVLQAREDADRSRREAFAGFVAVYELCDLFEAAMSVPRAATLATLRHLSTVRVVEPFNPADHALGDPDARVKVTPRGRLHLDWALKQRTYVRLMAEVDPIASDASYYELLKGWQAFIASLAPGQGDAAWLERQVASTYVRYVLAEADAVSPLVGNAEVDPMRRLESSLRAAWG